MLKVILMLFLFVSLFYSCKSEHSFLNSNNSLLISDSIKATKIYHLYKERKFNLLIAFKINSPYISLLHPEPYKILGRRNNKWYKIELYKAGTYKSREGKDSIAQKEINENIKQILNSYQSNHLYSLTPTDFKQPCVLRKDTLINGNKSIIVETVGSDGETIEFIIVNNNRYKTFSCYDPLHAVHICPEIKAYQYVLNMYNDIKRYW